MIERLDIAEDLYEHKTKSKSIQSNNAPYFLENAEHMHVSKEFKWNLDEIIPVENINGRFKYLCFRVNDIPFKREIKKLRKQYKQIKGIDALTLIDEGMLLPFFLFFRKKFIKLSQIQIYNDNRNTHIIFPYDYYNTEDFVTDSSEVDILWFTEEILYNENNKYYDAPGLELAFGFDEEGLLDPFGSTRVYIDIRDDYVFRWGSSTYGTILNEDISVGDAIHLRPHMVILFKNGELYRDGKVEFDPYNCLTVNDGIISEGDTIDYKIFYQKRTVEEYNLLNDSRFYNHNLLKELRLGTQSRYDVDRETIETPYDYVLDPDISFDENMNKFFRYTNSYNEYMLMDRLESKNISVVTLKSSDITDRSKPARYSHPKRLLPNCQTILFVNGLMDTKRILSTHPYGIIYDTSGLEDDDIIEFVSFRLEGYQSYFTIESGVDKYNIDVGTDDFQLFVLKNHPDKIFEMLDESRLYYPLNKEWYSYDKDNNIITIDSSIFNNGEVIYIQPNRYSAYQHIHIEEECYRVILDNEFDRCSDPGRYLIFVNGKRLNSAMYRIILPETDKPFNYPCVYTHVILRVGDDVEVIYSPITIIDEVYIEDLDHSSIEGTGIDHLGFINGPIDYDVPLHKDYQFFFIDGKKIPNIHLSNIDHNTIRIVSDVNTVQELSILCPDEDLVQELLDLNIGGGSLLDQAFDKMNKDTINIMTGIYAYITNEGLESKADINKVELIHAIVRDFYTQVNKGAPMTYTYDEETFTKVDDRGNILLDVVDGSALNKNNVAHIINE